MLHDLLSSEGIPRGMRSHTCFQLPWTWGRAGSTADRPDCIEVGDSESQNRAQLSDITQDRGRASLESDVSGQVPIRHQMPIVGSCRSVPARGQGSGPPGASSLGET